MVSGSLFQMRRQCGNPRCKCARGELHASWYLSRHWEGKTKLTYIGRVVPDWLQKRVGRYQIHQKRLAAIRKIDAEISRGSTSCGMKKCRALRRYRGNGNELAYL